MADIQHKDIPDAQLHEPKGVSSASAGTSYVADGAGSGSWTQSPYYYVIPARFADVSAPSTVYAVSPVAGTIDAIYTVLEGPITVADSTVTFFIGATAITNSTITVQFTGSAAGVLDSSFPTAARAVTAGSVLKIVTDGASTTTAVLDVFIRIKVSA